MSSTACSCARIRRSTPSTSTRTYILERAELQGALVANQPQGLRDMNEKVYTAWFPQCCAPTLITRDMADITAFAAEHGKIVVKPLDGMGGKSIFVTETRRQEPARHHRDADRLRAALRHRAALPARNRGHRRFARAADRRRASPLRAGPHPVAHGQPRQPGGRRQGRGTRAHRSRSLARGADRPGARASAAWCSSGST